MDCLEAVPNLLELWLRFLDTLLGRDWFGIETKPIWVRFRFTYRLNGPQTQVDILHIRWKMKMGLFVALSRVQIVQLFFPRT